ncbi:hypothetical protein [Clostridium botulinum]|uniref:hypothetical protein n=1 Tax=Clostridium botulinum TaxID=1491 RepID=UPI003DA54BD1
MGHDIKTPISVINLLCENYETTENPELISSIPRELLKVADRVKMLNLTRINSFEKDFLEFNNEENLLNFI